MHRTCSTHLEDSIYSNNYSVYSVVFESMLRLHMLHFYYLMCMTEVTYITGYFFCWWHACSFYHLNYLPILNSKDFKVSNMFNTPPPQSVNVMLGEDHWNLREQCAGQVTFRAVRTASSLLARFRSWTQGNNCSAQQ